jgi:hypothetical protein
LHEQQQWLLTTNQSNRRVHFGCPNIQFLKAC